MLYSYFLFQIFSRFSLILDPGHNFFKAFFLLSLGYVKIRRAPNSSKFKIFEEKGFGGKKIRFNGMHKPSRIDFYSDSLWIVFLRCVMESVNVLYTNNGVTLFISANDNYNKIQHENSILDKMLVDK